MPLVYQQNINEANRLAVWHITEPESFFLPKNLLPNNISHAHKRLQHLAGRHLLCELFEDFPTRLIKIANTKKPFLDDEMFQFSISHAGNYAAAIVSKKNRVGVDIEFNTQKAGKIKDKFLSKAEQEIIGKIIWRQPVSIQTDFQNDGLLTLAWSIKESMFKWYGTGGIDFKRHLQIKSLTNSGNEFLAHCDFAKEETVMLKVHGLFFNDNFLTWVVR